MSSFRLHNFLTKNILAMPLIFSLLSLLIAFSNISKADEVKDISVFMAGDSTMSTKDPKDYPETGWGVPFATFFNDRVSINNLSKNGRSTRTFREDGLWEKILDDLRSNDIVIIQFGHNDEVESKVDRYTTPSEFKQNLINYISEVKAKGAQAILLTPVVRRQFIANGKLAETHPYAPLVREVAKTTGVIFVDMEQITKHYFENLGDEKSAVMFMHIPPGIHPNYPNGIRDNTHFNELGAREVAQLFLQELKAMDHRLTSYMRPIDPKHFNYFYEKK